MNRILIKWLATSLAVFIVPHLTSGIVISNFGTALAFSLVLGLINVVLKPILVFLTLPFTIVTLGFFLLIINALLFQFASHFVSGIVVEGFGAAFWASLGVSILSWFIQLLVGGKKSNASFQVFRSGRQERVRDLN